MALAKPANTGNATLAPMFLSLSKQAVPGPFVEWKEWQASGRLSHCQRENIRAFVKFTDGVQLRLSQHYGSLVCQ